MESIIRGIFCEASDLTPGSQLRLCARDASMLVQVRDLLGQDLELDLELQKTATGFTIPSLNKVPVTSAQQITEVMQKGYVNRCTAAHDINVHSSRSHALLIVEVASINLASGIKSVGKLTLCDLAGRCGSASVHPALHVSFKPLRGGCAFESSKACDAFQSLSGLTWLETAVACMSEILL